MMNSVKQNKFAKCSNCAENCTFKTQQILGKKEEHINELKS